MTPMMRLLIDTLVLLVLLVMQLSLVQSLPFPFDQTPVVLVWVIYAYQYRGDTHALWFLPVYGFVLEILGLSYAPAPWLLWTLVALLVFGLGQHVFTNRSFYSMGMTVLAALSLLAVAQLALIGLFGFMRFQQVPWTAIVLSHLWPALLATALLLFVMPWIKRLSTALF